MKLQNLLAYAPCYLSTQTYIICRQYDDAICSILASQSFKADGSRAALKLSTDQNPSIRPEAYICISNAASASRLEKIKRQCPAGVAMTCCLYSASHTELNPRPWLLHDLRCTPELYKLVLIRHCVPSISVYSVSGQHVCCDCRLGSI